MEVRKGYKQTEVGVIPEDWDFRSLNTITQIIGGGTPSTQIDEYWSGKIPWIAAGDISNANGRYVKETESHISELGLSNSSTKIMPKDTTIIIARGATVGRMAQLGKDMAFNQTCYCLLPRDGLDKNYLYYSMLFSVNSIVALSFGTIFGTITTNSFKDWRIPLPPLAEQEAIAEALSDADALIVSLETLLAKKRQVKQGAMSELLTGKRRLMESGEWKEKKLSDICWYQEGPGVRTWQFTKSGIKLLNGTNIFRGEINLDNTDRFISENLAYGQYAHFMADSGDIVIASSGITVEKFEEKVAFVRDEHLPLCMNTSTIRFKANKNVLQSSFLYFLLMSDLFKKQIGHQATGSAQLNFGPAHLNKVSFKLPDLPEQTAIAEILSDMDAEIRALEGKLSKARAVKAGMMSVLLTGKIRLI